MNNRPKRRKSDDNPYTLEIINNTNIVIFKDSRNKIQTIEVNDEVYNQMNQFELEDISQMHKIDKYIERFTLSDEIISKRSVKIPESIEDIVERNIINESIKREISILPTTQKRRLKLYYFNNMSFEEIARLEGCTKMAIKFSVNIALEKITKKIKK